MAIFYASKQYYFISLPIIALILFFVFFIIMHYYSEYKHKKEVIGTFKRYISPDVAEALVEHDKNAMALGGVKRNVALLFVDIRGFTKMSEELEPEKVVDILNGYLEMSTNQVFRFGGMVDKFIGDCVMAIFNAPIDLDDYVYKAVCAAYGIVQVGKKICDSVWEKYNKKLEFGVGVHFGDAVIGNIGSKTRMDFTAIGDTVNTASRIEASAGGNQVLISSDVYEVLKDRITVADAGDRFQIAVHDNGIGIDPKYHGKIFAKFVQLDSAYTKKESSTGLGLTITKELVELHGGKISLISEVNNGSTFIVEIPL